MRILTIVALAFFLAGTAVSGMVDPELEARLENAAPDQMFETLIFMKDQIDLGELKRDLHFINATRAERHRRVITELQRIATESQPDILAYLTDRKYTSAVGEFRGFWICNMIVAELTASEIYAVAARDDVDKVHSDFKGELIEPVKVGGADPPVINSVEIGVRAIKADSMWALGYTGQGRLVCNIDTGVDGNHIALSQSWRGANGYPPAESWYDSANPSNTFPHDEYGHGTHTMGTICGRSASGTDTVGVAIDAQWIASRAVDVSGGNIAAAFQWAADPDGNPNTVHDVPDAISNSWGSIGSCPPSYYSLIDNCEAAGAAVVFAAGNEGPGAQTLRIPANRITTPYNCFSVGAVNGANSSYPIAYFSSRGPSQCDGQTIKPEIVAPGLNVRSSTPGNAYSYMSGTSMACPHVAGAIALLRQVNPNATVDTIKWALMQSAADLGNPGEDNTYGWGIINVRAAMDLLPPANEPYLFVSAAYVVEPNNNYPDPGETIDLYIRLQNTGISVDDVAAVISTNDAYTTITSDSVFYGTVAGNDTSATSDPYVMSFSEDTPVGHNVVFDLHITGDGGYSVTRNVTLTIGMLADPDIADHDIGSARFTISNFGQYGLAPTSINTIWNGVGYKMSPYGPNYLFEGALFIGDGPTRVSNGARDENQNMGDDFNAVTDIVLHEPGPLADQEYHTSFNDQNAAEPLGVLVSQKSFAFSTAPDDEYIITEYTITNAGFDPLTGVLVAHFEDWDIPWNTADDMVNFDRSRNLGYLYNGSNYRGQQVLSDSGIFSFMALDNAVHVYPPAFTLSDKWSYMNAGIIDTAITSIRDCSIIITTGPYDLAPGQQAVAAFSILGGNSLADLQANADAAIARYGLMTSIDDDFAELPEQFSLSQNYPNPFNARTTISFSVPVSGQVLIEAFDLLGRKVETILDAHLEAGNHTALWDCSNLSSGIYFYRLTAGDESAVRKMTLIK
ncbi:MAG: S8 family peptidase [Candidatus Zixiibacteriota bacterium]|nr:MAG: S8 family peptidase [candidate division Zixibacteria bacterium]